MESNTTPLEVSFAGMDLKQAKCGIFCKWLGVCTSLLSMDLSRMGLDDEQGKLIASYVRKNNTLRKLELEGNVLGPKTAMEFGKTLKTNTALKTLNLESNTLASLDGSDSIGMYEFLKFFPENKTLLSLNIANN